MALRNAASFYQGGKIVSVAGPDLMATAKPYFTGYPGAYDVERIVDWEADIDQDLPLSRTRTETLLYTRSATISPSPKTSSEVL